MKSILFLPAVGALALACAGCNVGEARTTSNIDKDKHKAGVTSPDERLDDQRQEAATKGLIFTSDGVTVETPKAADPEKAETLRQNAEQQMQTRNVWFEAVGNFRDAILLDPKNAKSYEGLARAFLIEGKTGEAKAALSTAVKLDNHLSPAHYELGMVHQMDSDYAGAVVEWKNLAAYDPGYKDVYARMSIASYYAQNYSDAWTYLGTADKYKQSVPPQYRNLLKEVAPRP